jgi:hypothetical protein
VLGVLLYGRGFGVGLVGDDYTLLDAALREPLGELLTGRHGILGYYRPVSRELYFWLLGPVSHGQPFLYHVVNALTFAGLVLLLHAWLERWLGWRVALLAALGFVLFPPAGALLSWVSCAQDLIALFWGVAALLLHARGWRWPAGLALALSVLSKESGVVVAGALVALEILRARSVGWSVRARRLAPVFLGLAVAVGIAVIARTTWPAGTSVAIWSPAQMTQAWRLPGHLLSSYLPPSTLPGVDEAWRTEPWMLVAVALLAALAVPGRGRAAAAAPGERPTDATGGEPARGRERRGARPAEETERGGAARTTAERGARTRGAQAELAALRFGLVVAVLGMLPVGVILDRWRSYFFGFAALGVAVVLALLLARAPVWGARVLAALLAVVHFGSNAVYRPIESARGPARHAHVNHAFFRDNARLTAQMLDPLVPWCDVLRGVPRVVALGVPRQALFESLLGPALRVTCRDTVTRVRWPDSVRPDEMRSRFSLVRFEPDAMSFRVEPPDRTARVELAETLVLWRRHASAAACLAVAASEAPADTALRALEAAARAASLGLLQPDRQAAAARAAHGRALLARGQARAAAIELSLAWGLGRDPADLLELSRACEAHQAFEPAYDALREALGLRLDAATRDQVMRTIDRLQPIVLGGAPS